MKKLQIIGVVLSLLFVFSTVKAEEVSYEKYKTLDGDYMCRVFMSEWTFKSCESLWYDVKDDELYKDWELVHSFAVGFSPVGESLTINGKKTCVLDGEELSCELMNSPCSMNGKRIDCNEAKQKISNSFSMFSGILITVWILSLVCFIFWIIMLIHAISSPIKDKAIWIVVILFFSLPGAVAYYFVVKRTFQKPQVEKQM